MNQLRFQKAPFPGLHPFQVCGYSFSAVAKSAAGIGVLFNSMATPDAPCVFFYVVAQAHPFFGLWCLHHSLAQKMVARAGQPSGWPVSIEAGYANPVRATTSEIGVSSGSNNRYSMEVDLMASTLAPTHPQFVFVFAAVRRTERTRLFPCSAPLPVTSTPPVFPLSVITSFPLPPVCLLRRWRMHNAIPIKNVSTRRGSDKPAIAHLSIEAYHKLNRASAVSQFVGGDLQLREMSGLHQLYIPQIFSYLHEDISFVLEELKAKGLCQEFMTQSGLSEFNGGE